MNVELVCSVESCRVVFETYRPTADERDEPLCPRCRKARLVETETPGCDSAQFLSGSPDA